MISRVTYLLLFTALTVVAPAVSRADDAAAPAAPTKPWTNEAEFSFVSANGNTKSQTLAGKDTFGYTWSKTAIELTGAALNSKDKGITTAEKYTGGEKL